MDNPEFAEADLVLLHKLSPDYEFLKRADRDPRRYYKEILTELVEKTDPETIRLHRRQYEDQKIKENENINPGNPGGTEEDPPPVTGTEGNTASESGPAEGTIIIPLAEGSGETINHPQSGTENIISGTEEKSSRKRRNIQISGGQISTNKTFSLPF